MKRILKEILKAADYEIVRRANPILVPKEKFRDHQAIVSGATMTTDARQATLYDQATYCHKAGIEGSIVECGVWRGGAIGLAALAMKLAEKTPTRELHLFDAFDDICAPDPSVDGARALKEFPNAKPRKPGDDPTPEKGFYDSLGGHGTVAACRELIEGTIGYPAQLVHYHVGWFQNTVAVSSKLLGRIAILRLDGDWYDSTKICLSYLYDLVTPGGFIIIDDYGYYEGCRRAVDEFTNDREINPYLHRVDASCYYIQKT
jgi:O-methyltransferase